MSKKRDVVVIDLMDSEVGRLGERAGEGYVSIDRRSVTWFVPEVLVRHEALGPSRLELATTTVVQIDLLPLPPGSR